MPRIAQRVASLARCLALVGCASLVGCGGPGATPPADLPDLDGGSSTGLADQLDAQVDAVNAEQAAAEVAAQRAAAEALVAAADELENEPPSEIRFDDMQRGQELKGGGMLSTTLRGGIAAEEKLKLSVVENAINLFYGLEGRFPKDHDEFMERVVEFNQIELGPLKEPYEYWYNPENHELMKRPSRAAIDAARAEADAALAALPAE